MSSDIKNHMDHARHLEVATYGGHDDYGKRYIESITVECTKCGEVVHDFMLDAEKTTPWVSVIHDFQDAVKALTAAGGRGVELADRIDELRSELEEEEKDAKCSNCDTQFTGKEVMYWRMGKERGVTHFNCVGCTPKRIRPTDLPGEVLVKRVEDLEKALRELLVKVATTVGVVPQLMEVVDEATRTLGDSL
jgi:RNase P subunit RPR2